MSAADRELLELAAKAAGGMEYFDHVTTLGMRGMQEQKVHAVPHCGHVGPIWNPLDDDGDALRLAVKLKIDILNHESFCGANAGELDFILNEDHMDDPLAATRLAITRAAAEIGRAMTN